MEELIDLQIRFKEKDIDSQKILRIKIWSQIEFVEKDMSSIWVCGKSDVLKMGLWEKIFPQIKFEENIYP